MSTFHAVETMRGLSLHVVAVVLLYSGIQKTIGLENFRRGLLYIPYMRVSWTYAVGYGLPFAEIALAVALLAGARFAVFGAIVLFVTFSLVAALALRKRLAVPCNCFGAGGTRVLSRSTIATNAVLIVLTAIGAVPPARDFVLVNFVVAASLVLLVPMTAALGDMQAAARESRGIVNS